MPISPELISTLLESISAGAAIIVVILFLRYIHSRDQKDIKIHKNCEATIKDIVKTHDDRIEALIKQVLK